ncbi:uncharacterized protein JCM6883_004742 [Sporobolomyces salmoneus]|uniref:uncharacterized protein n=1 Tax=Sporobolomyces salmoneus TaxID=183962 RepID=UPI00317BD608
MSRHRAVKNLDLDDELDDGGFDSGEDYYEDMTSEQQAQMVSAVSQVESLLGGPNASGISTKEIRDSLWDSYFDVEGTVGYYLDVIHKREGKRKREEGNPQSSSLSLSAFGSEGSTGSGNGNEEEVVKGTEGKLAKLSIDDDAPKPKPTATTHKKPPSKLSSKIAAQKLSKSSSPSSSSVAAPPSSSSTPTPTAGTTNVGEEKKKPLSKLQLKMLAKQQAQQAATTSSSSKAIDTPSPASASNPNAAKEEDTEMSAVNEILSPIFSSSPAPAQLAATPSPFASSLLPPRSHNNASAKPTTTGGGGGTSAGGESGSGIELARHLSRSITGSTLSLGSGSGVGGGGGGMRGGMNVEDLWGLSPDDKVLEARKGTALSAEAREAKSAGSGGTRRK